MSFAIDGRPVKVCMESLSEKTVRIAVLPVGESVKEVFSTIDLDNRDWGEPSMAAPAPGTFQAGEFTLSVEENPLRIQVAYKGKAIQSLTYCGQTGDVSFPLGGGPLFGLGHGYKKQMDRRGERYDLRVNGQVPGIIENGSATSPTPYVISTEGWALFFHQPWKGSIDLSGQEGCFTGNPKGYSDIFVVACQEPLDAPREYYAFTGLPPMPPKYAFGYQQSYRTLVHNGKNYVLESARYLREHDIPCDMLIYLGTGYCEYGWNTYNGDFDFHPDAFPEPERMMDELHGMNYKISMHVTRCYTGLHGSIHDGREVSPLEYDHAKNYWSIHQDLYGRIKNEAWWPDDADEVDMEQRLCRHRMYYEGSLQLNPDVRPLQMQRNTFPGANKWGGIIWSGDVHSEWATLKNQVPIGLNVALSSSPFWGTDTGGFFCTEEFDGELQMRWVQYSVFTPFFRNHGRPSFLHNPWGWSMFHSLDEIPLELNPGMVRDAPPAANILPDQRVEPVTIKYIRLRYELLPYLYNLSHEATKGVPIMRPLWCCWPEDPTAVGIDSQYMLGESLMVAPVTEKGATTWQVYLPRGGWYNYWTGEALAGERHHTVDAPLDIIPLFVRAGGFLARAPVTQYVDTEKREDFDPLSIELYTGADGSYTLYEDDGISMGYQRGQCTVTKFYWNEKANRLSAEGSSTLFPGKSREVAVRLKPAGEERNIVIEYR